MTTTRPTVRSAHNRAWTLRDVPAAALATLSTLPPLLATLLAARGITSLGQANAFLSVDPRAALNDPFALLGMPQAADRIKQAITAQEPIAVYGDFDADGVTAVALLMQAISAMGGSIQPYIPHRLREGYGLNREAIDDLIGQGTKLLITVDCGISNIAEVAHAQQRGLDVIVTDHHTPPAELPPALVIVNPKQPGDHYPDKHLVGVGIAYKLVQALVRRGLKMSLRGRDLLDLVALGTVTDMGPLTGENRTLVKVGLESLNATERPGVQALLAVAGLVQGRVSAEEISFVLGPRLNAAGRLDDAAIAYELLLADNAANAHTIAERLNEQNRRRQELTKQVQALARTAIQEREKAEDRVIVLDDAAFPAGVVGLVAARLVEEYGRPVLLIERGDDVSRGSARSIPGFNIHSALSSCPELFERFGGHAAAAGFSIKTRRIPELNARLADYAETHLPDDALIPALTLDVELPLAQLSWDVLNHINQLEPFGAENPRPVLLSRRVHASDIRAIGADGQHLKLRLSDGAGGPSYNAIAFRLGKLAPHLPRHPWIDIAYTLEANEWNGNRTLQLNIKDLRRA